MATDRRPLDLALEAFVYVPVGLAVSAKELLPELARRGRERLTGQVTQARMIGEFAVHQGQAQAGKAFARAREDAEGRLAEAPGPRPATSGPGGSDLAIPGYDSLSASQVLPRLEGLAADELEAVRAYEAAHRGRKTILGRVAQLQSQSAR
ncbi:MAG: hypothetical protein JWN29_2965 [Acidimicrobiales bacterium]|nr:hypothetical protein [Acidimicrobiales bacterium]